MFGVNDINTLTLSTAIITQEQAPVSRVARWDPAAARSNASSETLGVKTSTSRVERFLLRLTVDFSAFRFLAM